jgi:D-alanyl-D-alanine carboxypeptidase
MEQIVEAAQLDNFPIVTAKAWAIADPRKGEIMHGKEQLIQREIASLTKIMTAYTVCRLMSELNINHPKNVYLRVSRKAAYMTGTTAMLR